MTIIIIFIIIIIYNSQYRVILLLSAKESFFGGRSQKYEHKAQISTTTSVANINYRFTEMIAWIHWSYLIKTTHIHQTWVFFIGNRV